MTILTNKKRLSGHFVRRLNVSGATLFNENLTILTNNILEAKNRGLEKLEGNNGSLNTSKPLINCYIGIFVRFVRQYFRRLEWKSRK